LSPIHQPNANLFTKAKLEDLSHIHAQLQELEQWFAENVDDAELSEFLGQINVYESLLHDQTSNVAIIDRHRRADGKKNQPRYDQANPIKGWKQITTGYRKWAQRYVAYCREEYIRKKFSKWAFEKLWKTGSSVYQSLKSASEA